MIVIAVSHWEQHCVAQVSTDAYGRKMKRLQLRKRPLQIKKPKATTGCSQRFIYSTIGVVVCKGGAQEQMNQTAANSILDEDDFMYVCHL